MAGRKSFLLRIDPELLDELRRWADDDLRSLNGQLEFLLRRALMEAGRMPKRKRSKQASQPPEKDEESEGTNET